MLAFSHHGPRAVVPTHSSLNAGPFWPLTRMVLASSCLCTESMTPPSSPHTLSPSSTPLLWSGRWTSMRYTNCTWIIHCLFSFPLSLVDGCNGRVYGCPLKPFFHDGDLGTWISADAAPHTVHPSGPGHGSHPQPVGLRSPPSSGSVLCPHLPAAGFRPMNHSQSV